MQQHLDCPVCNGEGGWREEPDLNDVTCPHCEGDGTLPASIASYVELPDDCSGEDLDQGQSTGRGSTVAIDVVTELREQQRVQRQPDGSPTYLSDLPGRAADEIERLRADLKRAEVAADFWEETARESGCSFDVDPEWVISQRLEQTE